MLHIKALNMRNAVFILICAILSFAAPTIRGVVADEVILTTGERFTSSKVWEENGKILFDMQGLIVNIDKRDVAAVVRGTGHGEPPAALPRRQFTDRHPTSRPASEPLTAQRPVPATTAAPTEQGRGSRPKLRGIGFDGLAWQMHPNEISGITKLSTDSAYGGIDQYWRPAGNLTLGDVLLDGVVFGFWQNRLYTILIWVNGKPAYTRLQRAAFDRYGTGRKSEKGLERYIWIDDTTDRMLEFDKQRNTGILWMRSRNLDMQVKRLYPGNE